MRTLPILIAAMIAACSAAASASPPAAWPQTPAGFASLAEIDRAAEAFPNSMGLQRRRLAAAVEAGDRAAVLDSANKLAAAGAGLAPGSRALLAPLLGATDMKRLNARFARNMRPLAASSPFLAFPASDRLIEGIAAGSDFQEIFGASVVDRRLVAIHPNYGRKELGIPDAGSLLGMVFDPRSRRLWVASAVIDETPKAGSPFSGLLSVDPGHPEQAVRIPAPRGATLGDVAVAADGVVYASDGLTGAVYACRPGCSSLEVLVPPGRLFSAQGMAVSIDRKWLYVADRRFGLAAVERSSGRIFRVAGAQDMMLDGIDGLVGYDGDLIATQTAYAPQRIVRLRLSRGGLRVTKLDVLERANPEWGEVTLAALAGDRLLYVAAAQWESFGEGGIPKGDGPPEPTRIRMLKLK